jgi:hypothetical protein
MTNSLAHRTLTTEHKNLIHNGLDGRVSVRKHQGEYIVHIERYSPSNHTYQSFKTLRGALIAFEGSKGLVA